LNSSAAGLDKDFEDTALGSLTLTEISTLLSNENGLLNQTLKLGSECVHTMKQSVGEVQRNAKKMLPVL
jgi:hypothetical protein